MVLESTKVSNSSQSTSHSTTHHSSSKISTAFRSLTSGPTVLSTHWQATIPVSSSSDTPGTTLATEPLLTQTGYSTKSISTAAVAGCAVAGVTVICILVAIGWCIWRRGKRGRVVREEEAIRWHMGEVKELSLATRPYQYPGTSAASRTTLSLPGTVNQNKPESLRTAKDSLDGSVLPSRGSSESEHLEHPIEFPSLNPRNDTVPLLQRPIQRTLLGTSRVTEFK